jgi:hypothetical protein
VRFDPVKASSSAQLRQQRLRVFEVARVETFGEPDVQRGEQIAKIIENATLKIYKGAPPGMCTTRKREVNEDLLAFLELRATPVLYLARVGGGRCSRRRRRRRHVGQRRKRGRRVPGSA